ncbi:MAG: dTDP-4-dehydrorhamnose reductase [Bacteroidales bacterium]|nr:dTDP-4-dehydrorhamnose reductase [Bacteroidales bacterium]
MNILVTGALGQLGSEIRAAVRAMGPTEDHYIFSDVASVPGEDILPLDITNSEAVGIICRSEKVDVIVNCAAYTDVEKAESDLDFADLINHRAVGNLAKTAAQTGATLIHISTDYVFDGEGYKPYTEEDAPAPLSAYAVTKFAGEKAIQKSGCRYIIIRSAWLYSTHGRNFVKTMLSLTASRDSIRVVCDQIGTPTCATGLAALIVKIISERLTDRTGIYNYTDEGVASWYDFAHEINVYAGHGCNVQPCLSVDYPTKARRPHYSVLDKSKVKRTFGVDIPHWTQPLKNCIDILKNEE